MTIITEAEVLSRLRRGIVQYGSQSRYAEKIGISPQWLSDILNLRRPIGDKTLRFLNLERAEPLFREMRK